jgi:TolB protein
VTKRAVTTSLLLLVACGSPKPAGPIAFSSDRDGNPEIYLINADGTGLERLTYGPTAAAFPVCTL